MPSALIIGLRGAGLRPEAVSVLPAPPDEPLPQPVNARTRTRIEGTSHLTATTLSHRILRNDRRSSPNTLFLMPPIPAKGTAGRAWGRHAMIERADYSEDGNFAHYVCRR